MKQGLFLLAIIVAFPACRHSVEEPAKNPPAITLQTPLSNQHFIQGDTIRITGRVTCTVALTEVAVHITDIPSNNEFFHNHFAPGNILAYAFSSVYPVTDARITSFRVRVEAVNANGDEAGKEVIITVN